MKINIKLLSSLVLTFLTLSSCSGGSLEITGKVHVSEMSGFKCWYIVDDKDGLIYELVSGDEFLLQEGKKAVVEAKRSSTDTVCKVGDRVEVVSYRVIN
jgi:hypothetical protein